MTILLILQAMAGGPSIEDCKANGLAYIRATPTIESYCSHVTDAIKDEIFDQADTEAEVEVCEYYGLDPKDYVQGVK